MKKLLDDSYHISVDNMIPFTNAPNNDWDVIVGTFFNDADEEKMMPILSNNIDKQIFHMSDNTYILEIIDMDENGDELIEYHYSENLIDLL